MSADSAQCRLVWVEGGGKREFRCPGAIGFGTMSRVLNCNLAFLNGKVLHRRALSDYGHSPAVSRSAAQSHNCFVDRPGPAKYVVQRVPLGRNAIDSM